LSPALFVALLAAGPLDAGTPLAGEDAPTVTVRVDKPEAHVGDRLAFSITSVGPRAMPVVLPAKLDLAPFAELDRHLEETDLGDGRMRREVTLGVATYEPGGGLLVYMA